MQRYDLQKKMKNSKVLKLNNFRINCYLSSNSSSGTNISTAGSFKISLLDILFSSESNSDGSSNKLDAIANRSVIETSPPNAIVPPKLETVNTRNPKNNTMEV